MGRGYTVRLVIASRDMKRLLVFAVVAMLAGAAGGKAPERPATPAFWKWFQKNAAALRADKNLQRTMETISKELERGHPGVFAEIGGIGTDRMLVISVDGKRELFPAVQEIYAARPTVAGWKIVAFRPRMEPGDPFVINMNGKKLDPKLMKFTGARNGEKLDISVFIPGFTTLEEFGQGSFIVLDHVVGEYDMETKIGGIRWAAIDKAPAPARPLVELPALLDKTFPPPKP
jgi:hypothetical protein